MKRLAWLGAGLGALLGALLFAPAAWLAAWVDASSGGQLLLSDARGTIWRGDAQLVLSGGSASRDALALPGRLHWRILLKPRGAELRAQHACCMREQLRLHLAPRWGGYTLSLAPQADVLVQWPAGWLVGLGAPWNTLQPAGQVQLASPGGLSLDSREGRIAFRGSAELRLDDFASRLSTLPSVGSYRLAISGQPQAGESAQLTLATLKGPLQLSGSGQWGGGAGSALRFRGLARAEPGSEAALSNLLNLIGRRQGATSVLTIG